MSYWILDSDAAVSPLLVTRSEFARGDHQGFIRCFCGEAVPQYDATGGGSGDPEFDYPATVECENCGQHWQDGNPVDDPCPYRRKA